ncbi:MAG: SIR2 family protein [Gammaproteobacteria bacterium]|nr:SIR2 family protein [Gammaproteobacteria bacterium]
MDRDIQQFIKRFLKEIEEDNAAIFAGAGLSAPAGYVNWKELLRPLVDDLGLDIDREQDLVSLAQYHHNENGRHRINQQLIDELSQNKSPTENHRLLAKLPISTYWTTNYDRLIEDALKENSKIPDAKYTNNHLATTKSRRDAVVYKMHGDIEHPDQAVLTKDDYEKYTIKFSPFVNALSGDLVSKTFLFLGFSFTDPNLDYILSRIRIYFKEHQRQHFCIFKRCHRDEYGSDAEFEHAKTKQQLVIGDLGRFNIKVLLVDQHSNITCILSQIEREFSRKTVFISGSASDFGAWTQQETETALSALSGALIDSGFKIATGVGLGIGNAVISGAISSIYRNHRGHIEDNLIMRPFPQFIEDKHERDLTWDRYRRDLIGKCGVALFFMGNKIVDGKTINADGVRKEFEIAKEMGLALIPIGGSEFMARELWNEINDNFDAFFSSASPELKAVFNNLGDHLDKPSECISIVLEFLNLISKE